MSIMNTRDEQEQQCGSLQGEGQQVRTGGSVAPSCHLWQVIAMKWRDFLSLIGGVTLFESSMLLAGEDSPAEVRRQISRWVTSGRLLQLRRGLYALAPPQARELPDALAVASRLHRPS